MKTTIQPKRHWVFYIQDYVRGWCILDINVRNAKIKHLHNIIRKNDTIETVNYFI